MIDRTLAKDASKIIAHAEARLSSFKQHKQAVDRLMYVSILFYLGKQWVTFDVTASTFRRTNQRRMIPQPVTNKFKSTVNSINAALSRFDPKLTFAPQTDSEEDMVTAYAATRISELIKREVNWEKRKTELIPWLTLNGNCFVITGIDPEHGPMRQVMKMKCPVCDLEKDAPTDEAALDCPRCAEFGAKSPLQPKMDTRTGQSKIQEEPTGEMTVDLASCFEMFLDYRIQDIQRHQTIIRIHNKDLEWSRERWPTLNEKIQPHKRQELNARIQSVLAQLALPAGADAEKTVDLVEVWEKPSPQFKQGFYLVYSQDKLLHELTTFDFRTNTGAPFFPIVHFPFDKVPGSVLATTPAFDLVEKQTQRNRLEAIIEMMAMKTSNPVWLLPTGTETDPTGIPGQRIRWDPHASNNVPPQRIEGAQITNSLILWMDRYDRDMAEISGQYEVARGERPLSVKTGKAIEKLREIASDRNVPLLTNFAIAEAEWMQQAFEIFRRITPEGRYFRVLGEDASWTVSKLQETDLKGAVDIFIEPGATIPRSHLEKIVTLDTMLEHGLINPADPLQLVKLHRMYGMPGLLPSLSADDAYIIREHDRFKRTGQIAVNPFDNHPLHLARHGDYWKSEGFENVQNDDKQAFFQHMTEHQQALAAAQQQAPVDEQKPQGQITQAG
jgi:hypothetical protein